MGVVAYAEQAGDDVGYTTDLDVGGRMWGYLSQFFCAGFLRGVKRETSIREVKNHLAGAERKPVKFEGEGFEGLEMRSWDHPRKSAGWLYGY